MLLVRRFRGSRLQGFVGRRSRSRTDLNGDFGLQAAYRTPNASSLHGRLLRKQPSRDEAERPFLDANDPSVAAEGVPIEPPPQLRGGRVQAGDAGCAEAAGEPHPVRAVDVAWGAEAGLGVVAELVGARQVDARVQGAGGAGEGVLGSPGLAPGRGRQDELRAPGRRLACHLGEAEVPADGERDPQAASLDDGQVRPRGEGAVFGSRLYKVALPVRGEDPFWAYEVCAVEDACDRARCPLREPVGDEDVEFSGEIGEKPGAHADVGVFRVPVDRTEVRVPAGKELREYHVPQRGIPPAQPPYGQAGEPEVTRHLARHRAEVQRRDGRGRARRPAVLNDARKVPPYNLRQRRPLSVSVPDLACSMGIPRAY